MPVPLWEIALRLDEALGILPEWIALEGAWEDSSRMPRRLTYPGIYVKEVSSGIRAIEGVATAITVFIGWSPAGRTDKAVRVGSFDDYKNAFGGLHEESLLGHAVWHFFANGGRDALIIRIAEAEDGNPAALTPDDPAFAEILLDRGRGVHLLDEVDLFNLLCVPGFSEPTALQTLQQFCLHRRAFLIIDSGKAETAGTVLSGSATQLVSSDSMNAALYFPWVEASDPVTLQTEAYPPCGFVAGIMARTDASEGVWKAPAGVSATLMDASGPAQSVTDRENTTFNAHAVNCIRSFPSLGTVCWGGRTLHGQQTRGSEWKYVNVRRTALFIEESLLRGLKWVVFEGNDENLWQRIRQAVEAFMENLFRKGAFQGAKASEAFFVKCDRETMTQKDVDRGRVHLLVGFAPLKPAEFVLLHLTLKAGGP
jgi:phage tail sheath protein FI